MRLRYWSKGLAFDTWAGWHASRSPLRTRKACSLSRHSSPLVSLKSHYCLDLSLSNAIFSCEENMRNLTVCALLLLIVFQSDSKTPPRVGECTLGIFTGQATTDGRPLLWKNRDILNGVQKFCYYAPTITMYDTTMSFIANAASIDTTRVYMGVNSAGFAIINGNSYNLNDQMIDGIDDGFIIKIALERCRTIFDFEHILDATSVIGRKDCWNYGAVDAFGNAALYECANYTYVKYNVADSVGEGNGLILRATFSFSGNSDYDGLPRYKRATELVRQRLLTHQGIDPRFILQTLSRDLANPIANPYPLPYNGTQNGRPEGFICVHDSSINRETSRSVMVIRGVLPGEDPRLATIYAVLGQPVLSVAYPLWVESHSVPPVLNQGTYTPMYSQVAARRAKLYTLHDDGEYLDSRYLIGKDSIGVLTYTTPLETTILNAVETYMTSWRQNIPNSSVFAAVQNMLADSIYNAYCRIPLTFPVPPLDMPIAEIELKNYPNPFNANTTIDLSQFAANEPVDIKIYDMMGREIRSFSSAGGDNSHVVWDGRDRDAKSLSSGVYFINAAASGRSATIKALLIK
ncbi:MAG TPA: hypothetical protein DEO84_03190 [candidate division Zixibacteria bacterium]|nr:hypothetical protein [candidate division Zixibacteria bacterium]